MPRLSHPSITKGHAISALMKLYRNEPDFIKELKEIRKPYMEIIKKFASEGMSYFVENNISPSSYYQEVIDYISGKSPRDPFPAEKFNYLAKLQPYFDALGTLAVKWKLHAPWAVVVLFALDICDSLLTCGLPEEVDIPIEFLGSLYPWSPPLPPLKIDIPAWAFIILGREEIMSEIANKLKECEGKLKETGVKEYPSSLQNHARWWFEHYVHGKKLDEIAEMEAHTPGGSLISYAKNVGIAVRAFSRLIGIDPKSLK